MQNGSGTWNLTTANWIDSGGSNVLWTNSGSEIAQFGGGTVASANTVSLNSATYKLAGLNFLGFSAAPGTNNQYTLNTGTLDFGSNGVIQMADQSSGGSQFVTLSSALSITSSNLTIQKLGGTALQFINLTMTTNPNLTGTFTVGSGIYAGITTVGTLGNSSSIVVQSGGTITLSGSGTTYAQPFSIAGFSTGSTPYGAIRINNDNLTLSGGITLTAMAGIQTNYSTSSGNGFTGTVISGVIKDDGNNYDFHRYTLGRSNGTLTLSGASTYGGKTVLGRALAGYHGGVTILDFTAASAPASDIVYNNVGTAGGLDLIGGAGSSTVLRLNGAANEINSQRFGDVTFTGTRSVIQVNSGTKGTMNLTLGNLTRTGSTLVTFEGPASGSISTTRADSFLGPQVSYVSASGTAGASSWARIVGGKVTGGFAGDTSYATGANITSAITSHLNISSTSAGNVLQTSGTTHLATVSMTDTSADRLIPVGASNVLRLSDNGGIQLTSKARSLTVGSAADVGSLSAGGTVTNTAGVLVLSNHSTDGTLTINSKIVNNGTSGAVTLLVQGVSGARTVLTGTNTHTGGTTIASGSLEVQNVGALGTSGTVAVLEGGSLVLAANLPATFTRSLTIAGDGANAGGALRSLGTNQVSSAITQSGPSRITSDAGTLTLKGALPDTVVLAGSYVATFAGAGTTVLASRFGATSASGLSASLIKEGSGTLIVQGSSNYTSTTTINAGTMQLDFSPTTAGTPTTNLLYNGLTTAGALTLGGGTLQLQGKSGVTSSQAFGTLTLSNYSNLAFTQNGATGLSMSVGAITRNFGALLGIDLPSNGTLTTTGGSNNAIISTTNRAFMFIRDAANGDEWAATDTAVSSIRNIVKLSAIAGGYTASTATALSGNANIALGVTSTDLAATTTNITSLRFAQGQATTISGTGKFLNTGGILVSSTVGANTSTISVGTLRPPTASANTDLPIIQNNPLAPLVVSSVIANATDGGSTIYTASLLKAGVGVLELRGANTFSGNLRVYEGTVQFAAGSHSSSVEYLMGSGTSSGKIIYGSGSTAFNNSVDYISVVGVGTANSIVGGASVVSEMTLGGSSEVSDFSAGFLGGSGTNENNLAVTISNTNGRAIFGPANTYAGQTAIRNGVIEASVLSPTGTASSLGTGSLNSVIDLGGSTVAAPVGTLRYTGSTNSVTNRVISLANSSTSTSVVGVIENNGTGTLQFTNAFTSTGSNVTGVRTLRLKGTNTGANQIVGIGNNGANGTIVEKSGSGTWTITGASTHAGGTNVLEGTLLTSNTTGSATGTGNVSVSTGAILGGTGRIAPAVNNSVLVTGATLTVGDSTLSAPTASMLTLATSGTGSVTLQSGSYIDLDLINGAGGGDHTTDTAAADRLAVGGAINLGTDSTLRVANPSGMTGFNAGDLWRLFDWTTLLVSGTFASVELPTLDPSYAWDTSQLYSAGVIGVIVVPEPSRACLILAGLLMATLRRRR